jgi:hypothetical protein
MQVVMRGCGFLEWEAAVDVGFDLASLIHGDERLELRTKEIGSMQ